jgi:predicted ATPase
LQPRSDGHRPSSAEVSINLLGGFVALADGEPLTDSRWRLRKGRELVKLLALASEHRLHREQLMDTLWPDRDPAAAANNLNQVVHTARRVLGADAIELREELLTLRAQVDVDEFERAAAYARRAGAADAYEAALSLYSGELLPENRYDDWAACRREELDRLRAELEVELAALGPEAHASALPRQASSFVGRAHELRELSALLQRTRLLTLAGPGGAGKTRLALELARHAEPAYAHGAALVELASVGDGRLVATAAATALDVGALPGRSPLQGIVDYLMPRSLLLVLDNCEHVLAASAALCDAVLRAAPDLTILATTREPLRVDGEVVFRVPSLAIADPERELAAEELMRYEAVRLFAERGGAADPGFVVDADNAPDVARICFRLDGLPLALELAAARLGALGTSTLAARLDDRFKLLRAGSRAAPTRQQTLLATLQWSHDLLADDEQVLLRRLAVFAGGFDLAAAESVCGGEPLASDAIVDVLARLVEKSLVSAEEGGRDRRYRLLETVRIYAAERLDEAGERATFGARHAGWALTLAEREGAGARLDREAANLRAAHEAVSGEDALRYCVALLPFWLRRIDLEEGHDRLTAALAAEPQPSELRAAALLAVSAIDFRAGMLSCGETHARESYEIAADIGDPRMQWRGLQRLAEFAIVRDDAGCASSQFDRARDLAHDAALPAEEAISVYSLGFERWLLGDLDGAEARLADSAALLRSVPDPSASILSPLNISEALVEDPSTQPRTRIVFEETLQPFLEITCETAIGYVLANHGTIARLRGEPDRARRLLEEARERFERSGDERGQAAVLVRRAHLELAFGAPAVAREYLQQALTIRQRMGDRRGVGMALVGLGRVGIVDGEHELAERQLAEARELFRRAGDRWGLVSSLWVTADLELARGRLDDAAAAVELAREVVGETERRAWIAVTVAMQAELARLRGDEARAVALLAEAGAGDPASADAAGAATVERRAQRAAKNRQTARKAAPRRNGRPATTRKRRGQ